MSRPPRVWLITDTHFHHNVMVKECGWREDFVDKIITNCRHLIAEQDILFHLGDVIFYKYPELKFLLDSILGKKILVKGNHDRKSDYWYMRNGFDFVADRIVWNDCLLSHVPARVLGDRVKWNIHGHLHRGGHENLPDWYDERHLLLSIEEQEFKPVRLDEFLKEKV